MVPPMTEKTPGTAPELLSRREAADLLRVSTTTVSRHIANGSIYAINIGRQVRIPRESLRAFLQGKRFTDYDPEPLRAPDLGTWPPTPSLFAPEPDAEPSA